MKKGMHWAVILMLGFAMISCSKETGTIDVSWRLITNQYEGENKHLGELTLTNNSRYTLKNDNWEYAFSWFRTVAEEQPNPIVRGEWVNGDYMKLHPNESFPELKPGRSITFPFVGSAYVLNFTDAPTGGYFILKRGRKEIIIESGDAKVLDFPEESKRKRSAYDNLKTPTAESRYKQNADLTVLSSKEVKKIMPTPANITIDKGYYSISGNMDIFYQNGLANEARYLQSRMKKEFGKKVQKYKFRSSKFQKYTDERIILKLTDGDPESYYLETGPERGVLVYGADPAGIFYGIQSLFALFEPNSNPDKYRPYAEIPRVRISDSPRFEYRGVHLDVSRSFHSASNVMQFIDLLSVYKMNRLHFHITDDEGWRIEIPGLPELTEIGAVRGHTDDEKDMLQPSLGSGPYSDPVKSSGSGYYSRKDFIEILRFARHHHVQVIPEIDMPGHVRSALKAMEARYDDYMEEGKRDSAEMYLMTDFKDSSEYTSAQRLHDNTANPCMDGTYRFIEKVVTELKAMYDEAGMELSVIHIGGDEVPRGAFEKSSICQEFLAKSRQYDSASQLHKYFALRFNEILKKYDITAAGWEEIVCTHESGRMEPDPSLLDQEFTAYVWNSVWGWGAEDLGYRIANTGFPVVLLNASNYYFDFAYNKDPWEPGLYWGGYTNTRSAWEFTPYNMSRCAEKTLYGHPVDKEDFAKKAKLTEKGRKNILGLSGTLWSENLRTWDRVEYMAFPKILGLAERAWAPQPEWASIDSEKQRVAEREKAWNDFVNTLGQREMRRMDAWNVMYRIPLPGAVVENGILKANIRFPGLTLRYTTDGSEPRKSSVIYRKPVNVGSKTVKIAAFSSNGRKSRTVTL